MNINQQMASAHRKRALEYKIDQQLRDVFFKDADEIERLGADFVEKASKPDNKEVKK